MDPSAENPYAPPVYEEANYVPGIDYGATGLRREGVLLVATKYATFPDRCVKCNAPAEGYRLKRKMYWHHPAVYLVLLICNLLVYAIVAIAVRKSAAVHVGVCPVHRDKRRNAILFGWGGFLLSVGMFIAAGMLEEGIIAVLGIPVLIGALIYGIIVSRIVYPKRIDATYAWIGGAGTEFLHSIDVEAATAPGEFPRSL